MLDISIIICSHNPRAHYLRRTLEALQNQTLPQDRWELLIIDNASSVRLAESWDLSWHSHARHIVESELGLSAARRRGIREARGEVLMFVDDDNVLEANYLSEALRIGAEWPRLGTWGSGNTLPEFEEPPPERTKPFFGYLALREASVARWSNVMAMDTTPWGAGMCVRRQVAIRYCEKCEQDRIQITDRTGASLASGGDVEISHIACEMGLGSGVFPELRLLHLIPKVRLSTQYLMNMVESASTSHYLITYKWTGQIPGSPFRPHRFLVTLINLLLSGGGLERRRQLAVLRGVISARRILLPGIKRG
jgi:glycosyltransferase involved in cell wall biosynthesis